MHPTYVVPLCNLRNLPDLRLVLDVHCLRLCLVLFRHQMAKSAGFASCLYVRDIHFLYKYLYQTNAAR